MRRNLVQDYEAPTITEIGSLQELTLLPGGTVSKSGGAADMITAATGLGGTLTVSS